MTNKVKVNLTMNKEVVEKAKELGLNLSQFCENALKEAIEVLEQRKSQNMPNGGYADMRSMSPRQEWCGRRDLDPGRRRGSAGDETPSVSTYINWVEAREDFIDYMRVQGYEERTIKDAVSYLDKYAMVIREPQDIITLFSKVKAGKRHVAMGLRYLFNFYEALGFDKAYLDVLRNMLPKDQTGVDLKIPSETKIVASLKRLECSPMKYHALYDLLLDSGLRLIEAVNLINNFREAEAVNGFYRCELAMFRGEKQAYYGHFTEATLKLIQQVKEKLDPINASHYFQKLGYVAPKYLRKFAFDKMIELEIPESVADFIEGRVPKRIGAKHYMALARQGSKFYPRYFRYLESLRNS